MKQFNIDTKIFRNLRNKRERLRQIIFSSFFIIYHFITLHQEMFKIVPSLFYIMLSNLNPTLLFLLTLHVQMRIDDTKAECGSEKSSMVRNVLSCGCIG